VLLATSGFAPSCDSKDEPATTAPPPADEAKKTDEAPAKAEPEEPQRADVGQPAADAEGEAQGDEPAPADAGGGEGGGDGGAEAAGDEGGEPEPKDEPKQPPKEEPKKPPKEQPKNPPKEEPAASGVDGKEVYLKKCKNCHGVKGDADTKIGKKNDIPSWKEPGWKSKWSLAKVKDIVENGEAGTKMKAFKTKLSADEIDAVSKYARTLGK
jgi:cytochrome c553